MVQDIVDIGLALGHEFRVVDQVAEFAETVYIIGGLFEPPPVGTPVVGILAHLEVAGPAAAVKRIRHRFRMACQAVLLPLKDLPDPAFGCDVGDQALRKDRMGRYREIRSMRHQSLSLLPARCNEQGKRK